MSDNTDWLQKRERSLEGSHIGSEWKSTREGRIVYNRVPHAFSTVDLLRIARSTRERWDLEKNQPAVYSRIEQLMVWCLEYLRTQKETSLQGEGLLEEITDQIRAFTEQMIQEILEKLGVPVVLSIAITDKVYNMLYNSVSDVLKIITGGIIHGEKNR